MIHVNEWNNELEQVVGPYNQTFRSNLRKAATTNVPEEVIRGSLDILSDHRKGNNAQWLKAIQVWKACNSYERPPQKKKKKKHNVF